MKRRITLLAVAAVALCVFIVVVVMTVMNSLVIEFKNKNHDFVGDCVVSTESLAGFPYWEDFIGELKKQDFVAGVSAVIKGFGLVTRSGAEWNVGVELMGLNPAEHGAVTGFADSLYYHKTAPAKAFVPNYEPDAAGCVVGIDLMGTDRDRSGEYFHTSQPSRMELVISCFPLTAKGALAKVGTDIVNTMNFCYSDDSHTGIVRADSKMIYISFDKAWKLFGMDMEVSRISAIHIRFGRGTSLDAGCEKVRLLWQDFVENNTGKPYINLLSNVSVQSWVENRRSVIAPMEKEQVMLMLLFFMLGIITIFIIFVVFYMIISHKSKDIGVLKSVGVSSLSVFEIFILFAVMTGLAGAIIGVGTGCLFIVKINDMENWLFEHYNWQLWDRSVYAIGKIPSDLRWEVLAMITACAVAACVLGAFVPTLQAARRRPAEILQVNQL